MAAIEKDAGDDPDVTHGAIIRAEVRLRKESWDWVSRRRGGGPRDQTWIAVEGR